MSDTDLEKRMAGLEEEVAVLREKLESLAGSKPWWERIAGTFQNDPIYERAMKLGQKYRRAQLPNGSKPHNK